MGLSTNEALQNMLARAETPAMRSFVRSIVQGEILGVSIGEIMRNLATEMRKRRRAAAEERAQKAPIKILFPLIFLIFPAMFVILLGAGRLPVSRGVRRLMLSRLPVTGVFLVLTAATAVSAVERWQDALSEATLRSWGVAGYSLLKVAIVLAFSIFVAVRTPRGAPRANLSHSPRAPQPLLPSSL